MTATEFARSIIEGPGGMNAYEDREVVAFSESDRVRAAFWTMRCLANPECEGSQEAIEAILARRNRRPGKNKETQ